MMPDGLPRTTYPYPYLFRWLRRAPQTTGEQQPESEGRETRRLQRDALADLDALVDHAELRPPPARQRHEPRGGAVARAVASWPPVPQSTNGEARWPPPLPAQPAHQETRWPQPAPSSISQPGHGEPRRIQMLP